MTVEAQNPDGSPIVRSGPYLGNGVTTMFDYDFPILADHEVAVVRQNADLTEDVLELTTDYTVTGVGNDSGGSVILNSGSLLPTGAKLVLLLSMAFDQTTAYSNQGRIKLELLEASLDKLTLACRQLLERAQRAVNVDAFGTTDVATLRANIAALAAIETQIVTVAGSIAGVNTVAGISTEVVQVAAVDNDVAALGPIASDITTVAGVDSDVTTVAGVAANVTTVAGVSAAVSAVAGIAADVTTVATNIADVITNAANIADIQNAYDNAQDAINAAGAAAQSAIDAANAAAALNLSPFGLTLGGAADAAAARVILGLGTLATVSPTGTPSGNTILYGDGVWRQVGRLSYSNVTGSRAVNTTYTNSTGRIMSVRIIGVTTLANTDIRIDTSYGAADMLAMGNGLNGIAFSLQADIPPGDTYRLQTYSGSVTVNVWLEGLL